METKKKQFKMPHTFVIIGIIILFAVLLTWIIPAGSYTRFENEAGIKVIDPNDFNYIDKTPVNPLEIPLYIVKAFIKRIDLMLVIMFAGGAFHILTKTGALHAVVAKMAKVFSTRVYLFLPILTLVFGLICTTQGVNLFIAFAPIMVMMAFAMGLDSITGASIILLGGAIGFSTGPLNINTTIVAQKIAGLPLYSGVGYRFICFAVFYVITNIYLIRYALKIQKHPELSPMYEIDKTSEFRNAADLDSFGKLDARKILIMLVFFASLILIVYGGIKLDWDMSETASVFLALAVIEGVLGGFGPSAISKEFLEGCKKMLGAAFIIGMAQAISSIMNAPAEAFAKTVSYVCICGAGMLVIVAYNLIGCIFRRLGDSRTPLLTVAIACACNIAGDLLLCAGLGLGTAGAAIATVAAQVVSVSFLIILAIVNAMGVTASAGVGVVEKVCAFIMRISSAFMQSISAFVAQNYGAGRMDRARKALHYGAAVSFVIGVGMFFLAYFYGDLLAGIFSSDAEVIAAAADYLRAYAIDCLFTSIFFCYTGYYNGIGQTRFVMLQGIAGAFGVRVPVSYLISRTANATLFHIGLATPLSSIVQLLLCLGFMVYLKRKKPEQTVQ